MMDLSEASRLRNQQVRVIDGKVHRGKYPWKIAEISKSSKETSQP
jgi:hypothetical protein